MKLTKFKVIGEQDTFLARDTAVASTAVRTDVRGSNTERRRRPEVRGVVQERRQQQSD